MRGFSEAYGSWKIIWISRRSALSARAAHPGDVPPVEADRARAGSSRRSDQARGGVLPQPVSPTSPRVSPRQSAKLTPSTACTAPSGAASPPR